jgi:predicted DNA binding CopG/RHH family protein
MKKEKRESMIMFRTFPTLQKRLKTKAERDGLTLSRYIENILIKKR